MTTTKTVTRPIRRVYCHHCQATVSGPVVYGRDGAPIGISHECRTIRVTRFQEGGDHE